MNNASWWVCGRCNVHNPTTVAICQNPNCGGEPVSRSVEAVAPPAAQKPWVFNPDRKCHTVTGVPKHAYSSFDEAQEQCFTTSCKQKRLMAYPCAEHGWHIGSRRDMAA
jgi:hypothetical protein